MVGKLISVLVQLIENGFVPFRGFCLKRLQVLLLF